MQKKFSSISILFLLAVLTTVAGITYAAFVDKGKVLGSQFKVGSADIKLLNDILLGTEQANLVDEKTGPTFNGIGPNWKQDYALKIYNNGTSRVRLTSNANYLTANDPDELRNIIYVEPFDWDDVNSNGVMDTDEIGISYGRKTIVKWKTEGFDFGQVNSGVVKNLMLRFSTDAVSDTKQGKSAIFDFEFNSVEEN